MDCKDFEKCLDEYLENELAPVSRAAFESHADNCAECARKRDEVLTLRNVLRVEFTPVTPEGPDAFLHFKRKFAVREEWMKPRRRLIPARALGLAAVFVLLVGILLTNVPVSYSLPAGMRVVIAFDPPLTDAPEFESIILPKDFYDTVSGDEALIESISTFQGKDGLASLELELSTNDPEIAAKVYQALISNYPILGMGVVDYKGIEEEKYGPIALMLRQGDLFGDKLSDEEIDRIIVLKMPEIEKWIQAEITPLVDGIEIKLDKGDGGASPLFDFQSQLQMKILRIDENRESDESGVVRKTFTISPSDDSIVRMKIFNNNVDGTIIKSFIGCEMLDDKELEKLRDSSIDSDSFIEKLTGCIENWIKGGTEAGGKGGDIQTQVVIKSPSPLLKLDKGVVREYLDGKITAEEFKDKLRTALELEELPQARTDVYILKLDDGRLELSGIPLDTGDGGGSDVDINLDLSDLGSMLQEIEDALDGYDGDLDAVVEKYTQQSVDEATSHFLEQYSNEEWRELYEKEWKGQVDKWRDEYSPNGLGLKLQPFFGTDKDGCMVDVGKSDECITVQIVVDDESDIDEEGGNDINVDELITSEDKTKLKSGDITEGQFSKVLRARMAEKGYLEHDMHISIVADDYKITISVKDGDLHFDFELKQ